MTKPNIVIMLSDDHGWDETSYNGHPIVKTPVLDEMAATGLRFDRFYSACPVCSPTRASVMTGRNPNRSGCFWWNFSTRPEEITLAQMLKENGYTTGHFGKWHLGPVKADSPTNPGALGFDEWVSNDNFFENNAVLSHNGAEPKVHYGESSEIAVREAIRFINDVCEAQPFFVYLCFGSPHEPYIASDEDFALYKDAKIDNPLKHRYGEITGMDRAIGQMRTYLQGKGIAENTFFLYLSDNGIPKSARYATPFKGAKGDLYEGGVRVPAVLEYPALITQPGRSEMPCVTSDLLPTLLDLCGIQPPERVLDGISLRQHLAGQSAERPSPICFWNYPWKEELENEPWIDSDLQRGTTPTGRWAIQQFLNFRHPVAKTSNFGGTASVIDNRYKLLIQPNGEDQLYDIPSDSAERTNLAATKPQEVAALKNQLRQWQISVEKSLSGADYVQA